ncbi:DUF2345 domain-containing protein, partial [Undibacterium sp.]|uniref:DUF2345 domain-containing protein n=1 Tax=Undibacterium sp. TaxID=1914977 RepID=UPI00374D32C4
LNGQAGHDLEISDDDRSFVVLRVVHQGHNNLSADLHAHVAQSLGLPHADATQDDGQQSDPFSPASLLQSADAQKGEKPIYRNRVDAIRSKIPYRSMGTDPQGKLLHPKPTVYGQQTAVVVGPQGEVIHTDRDHRVKVQFHWQRGDNSHSRLVHPQSGGHTGAPANEQSGTWVRIATSLAPVAGSNWGSNTVPRIGQEVLVDFIEGDIDRPVIIGSLYNGQGQQDAQYNQLAQGAGAATGNAPAWFPGEADAHAHPAALSGIKTQAMGTSQQGSGGYNQLVFDDSPGESRTSLQSHASPHDGASELNLGHLRHQTDNQRLNKTGFGSELKTQNSAAVRAGQGLLISSDARTNATGSQLDSTEALAQIEASHAIQLSLAETAQAHNAKLKDDKKQDEPEPAKLPALLQQEHSAEVLKGSAGTDASANTDGSGGQGQVTAYSDPQIQFSSPAGIAATTPADAVFNAGNTSSITAGQDINFAAQGNHFHAVKAGIGLFTYGKVSAEAGKDKPNKETGIKLHAAAGKFSLQSQSDETRVTADKQITVASISKAVTIAAPKHVLLTAQGAYIRLEGGNIMIHGPGTMAFNAGMKELAGPASASPSLPALPTADELKKDIELNFHYSDLEPVKGAPYKITFADGTSRQGTLDDKGHALVANAPKGDYHVEYGEDRREWKPEPLKPDPLLQRARQQQDQAKALIEAERKKNETGEDA